MGLYFYSTELLDYLVYKYKEVVTSIKDPLLHLKFLFLSDFNAFKTPSEGGKLP